MRAISTACLLVCLLGDAAAQVGPPVIAPRAPSGPSGPSVVPPADHPAVRIAAPSLVGVRWVTGEGEEVVRAGVVERGGAVVTRFLRSPARAVSVRDGDGREHAIEGVVFLSTDHEGCRLRVNWTGEAPRAATILRTPNYAEDGPRLIAIAPRGGAEAPWRLFAEYRGPIGDDRQDFAARVPWRTDLAEAARCVVVDERGAVVGFVSGWTRTGVDEPGEASETRVDVIEARRFVGGPEREPLSWEEVARIRATRTRAGDLAAKARVALRFGQLGDAGILAREAVGIDPDDPFSLAILGDVLLAEGAYPEAAEALERASELAPAHVTARIKACFTHHRLGSAESMRTLSRLARELEALAPENPETQWYLAVRALRAGQGELAAKHLRRAVELRPDAVHYRNQLARFAGD